MLKFKKILLSLCLCLILLTSSVFATTMSEVDIKSNFADYFTQGRYQVYSGLSNYSFSDILTVVSEEASNINHTLSNNYLCYFDNYGSENFFHYYDLGEATLDSIAYSNNKITLYFTGTLFEFEVSDLDDPYVSSTGTTLGSSFYIASMHRLAGNTFDTAFKYSSNAIFTEPTGGGDGTLTDVLNSIVAFIPVVFTALWGIPIFKFILLVSICIGIIYLVFKLLGYYGLTRFGNKSFFDLSQDQVHNAYIRGDITYNELNDWYVNAKANGKKLK